LWRKHFPDDHASPALIKERVIVPDIRKHPTSLADATSTYVIATSSNVKILLVENEKMVNNS